MKQSWISYQMKDVVDVNDSKLSVRNYIEQKDLRCYLSRLKVHPNCDRRQKMSSQKGFRIVITGSAASTQSAQRIIADS